MTATCQTRRFGPNLGTPQWCQNAAFKTGTTFRNDDRDKTIDWFIRFVEKERVRNNSSLRMSGVARVEHLGVTPMINKTFAFHDYAS
jgi:hypothetical protein